MSIEKLLRDNIRVLEPYSSARDDFSGTASVFLDANENFQNMISFDRINRYPDPRSLEVKKAFAKAYGVDVKNLTIGNGSDELIDILYRMFCECKRDSVLIMPPTYGEYKVLAAINDVNIISVVQKPDFTLDIESIKRELDEKAPKLMFLCSPNNPTGASIPLSQVKELAQYNKGITVVDEAYIDFSTNESAISLISENERIVVLRTLSKAWGLAGGRIGIAIASEEITSIMYKVKYPYNIPLPSQLCAIKALNSYSKVMEEAKKITIERERVRSTLETIDGVEKIFPSDTNFLLVKVKRANEAYDELSKRGIIVRNRSKEVLCASCLRITIGSRAENDLMLSTLKEVLSEL